MVAFVVMAFCLFASGCNTNLRENTALPPPSSTEPQLNEGLWVISSLNESLNSNSTLPNIYVFMNGSQYYYSDELNTGRYTILTSSYNEDQNANTLTFNFYKSISDIVELTGTMDITENTLRISGTNDGDFLGENVSVDETIANAVANANRESGFNNVVQILDTNKNGTTTGQLRIKLNESSAVSEISSGRLTVDLVYQHHEATEQDANGSGDNAYVSLYATSISNANLHGEIALEKGVIKYRDASGQLEKTTGSFELGEKLAIEINWEPQAFSFSINDTEYGYNLDVSDGTAVKAIALRLGDNNNTTNYELQVDNLMIYSNDSGSQELILSDDFEQYPLGTELSTIYNSSSVEAIVISGNNQTPPTSTEVTEDFDSYTVGVNVSAANTSWKEYNTRADGSNTYTSVAVISDDFAKSGANSLLISDTDSNNKPFVTRDFSTGPTLDGEVSFDVYIPSSNEKTTYINIGSGKNNSDRFYELRISASGKVEVEAGENNIEIGTIKTDTWNNISLAWNSDEINVLINNVDTSAPKQSDTGLNSDNIPSQLTIYVGDTSGTSTKAYFDNIDSAQF